MSRVPRQSQMNDAGTASEEDARQKELDEIEALLGVQRPPSDKDKEPAKEEDTLGLLSSEDVPAKSGTSSGTTLAAAAAAQPNNRLQRRMLTV